MEWINVIRSKWFWTSHSNIFNQHNTLLVFSRQNDSGVAGKYFLTLCSYSPREVMLEQTKDSKKVRIASNGGKQTEICLMYQATAQLQAVICE
jgi:hypothetical protein